MIRTEGATIMNKFYPTETQCFCGEKSHLRYKTVANRYDDRIINVTNVPIYECSSLHDKTARITRVNLKAILKVAYDSGKETVEYCFEKLEGGF